MVAKQGWRMLSTLDSLVAHVYKARYFPNGSFLDAKLGPNPSYTWSNVFSTQQLIRSKARCRVGNGDTIRVFHDPWLPDPINPYVTTSTSPSIIDSRVSSLKIGLYGNWDIDLLHDIFSTRDLILISSIPLS